MKAPPIPNTFEKGMVQDTLESLQPQGTYRLMVNGIHEGHDHLNTIVNEQSTKQVTTFSGKIVGTKRLPDRDSSLIFTAGAGSEIWEFNHKTFEKKLLISDSTYGCDWGFNTCEWIKTIEIKYLEPCSDMLVYWSSDCVYHTVNLTAVQDGRKNDFKCDDFNLFNCECVPSLRALRLNNGNDLLSGAYQFVVQLIDEDGNETNWFNVGMPVYLKSKNNQPGERTEQSVQVQIRNLSKNYNRINFAVIKTIGGSKSAALLGSRTYNTNGVTYDYYAQGQEERIMDLAEILVKRKTYIHGQDLIQKDNRLYLYNIKQEQNLNYQKYANKIKIGYTVFRVPYPHYKEQPERYPSLMRDEIYAFGIQPQYCDGTTGPVFPIPGPQGSAPPCDCEDQGIILPPTGDPPDTPDTPDGPGSPQDMTNLTSGGLASKPSEGGERNNAKRTQLYGSDPYKASKPKPETTAKNTGQNVDTEDDKTEEFYRLHNVNTKELDASPEDIEDCADCAAGSTAAGDFVDFDGIVANYEDHITDQYRQDSDPKATNSDVVSASQELNDQILNSTDNSVPPNQYIPSFDDSSSESREASIKPIPIFDGDSCEIVDYIPSVKSEGIFGGYESCEKYPMTRDCDGELIYGELAGEPVRHFKTPTINLEPHFVSDAGGVISQKSPAADEFRNSFVYPLGINVTGVTIPKPSELPKPLCPHEPFKIVMVKREAHNRSVIAKGAFFGTYTGSVYGQKHYFPRHGVNSFENVDRHIEDEPGGSHIGDSGATTAYIFHSPDTNLRKVPLSGQYVQPEMEVEGTGYRYGQYAEGEKVFNAYQNQIDQRGTRQAVNLNRVFRTDQGIRCIKGQSYAEADTILRAGDGISLPLMNGYRESSVLVELESNLPALTQGVSDYEDASFVGDGLDHESKITKASMIYGAIKRNNSCQYGAVESMRYIDTGLSILRGQTGAKGPVGDTFIGPYSIKRTGYVSNKVGTRVVDGSGGHTLSKCNDPTNRDVCDPINLPNEKVKTMLGFDDYTKQPKAGERCDARNYANLHPGKFADEALGGLVSSPETDFYYMGTLTSLVHFWVESDANILMRSTGEEDLEEVHYGNIKGWEYDSAAPTNSIWNVSWMNQFYLEVRRPSKWQKAVQAFIRTMVSTVMPVLMGTYTGSTEEPLEILTKMAIAPFLIAIYTHLEGGIFGRGDIDELIGIEPCRTDEEGGTNDMAIKGFKDNYHGYNPDYQTLSEVNVSIGMPDPYNVCECDDCKVFTTQEILFSDPQNILSQRDAYKNFKANNYLSIPAHTGRIQLMFVLDSQFFVHTTDGIWIIQYKNGTVELTNTQALLVGGGDLLTSPNQYMEGLQSGYMGTTDPNASEVTSLGYIFVDREARKLIRFSGKEGMVDMSVNGMRSFFRNNIEFSSSSSCVDERADFNFSFGVDYRHNRIMVTKRDGTDSWTMSYDYVRNIWVSFHNYLPKGYLWDRGRLFSYTDDRIYLHNENSTDYQTLHGKYHPFIFEFTTPANPATATQYAHTILETEANITQGGDLNLRNRKITFNKAYVTNSYQSTGLMNLKPEDANNNDPSSTTKETYPDVAIERTNVEWRLNDIRDWVVKPNQPIWVDGANAWREHNDSIIQINGDHLQNNIVHDRFVTNRFIFDNLEHKNVQLVVKFAITHSNITPV